MMTAYLSNMAAIRASKDILHAPLLSGIIVLGKQWR